MSSQIKRQTEGAFFKEPREFKKRDAKNFPIGPRTIKRQEQNRILNERLPEIKKYCEIQIAGVCVHNIMLTWCHSKKSRFITTDEDWQEAARGCLPCHQYIEPLSHAEMKEIVLAAIARRKT